MSHTPGPWYYDEYYIVTDSKGVNIARVDNDPNGILIAAAPDLLAALKLIASIDELAVEDYDENTRHWRHQKIACAAINKAEGR